MVQYSYLIPCDTVTKLPNPMFYFNEKKQPININKLTIKGYPGLIFRINNSEYPIMIYNSNGVWDWNIKGEVDLLCIKFDPASLIENKDIIINTI